MPLAIAFRIESFEELASTQVELRRRLEAGEAVDGLVVRAKRQTQGRGRRGRTWMSAEGGSYQTLAVRDPAPPVLGRGGSAVAVAVGMAAAFAGYGVRLQVKWPNDLHYRGRKLGGVLTEYVRGHLLVGVGINVANEPPEGGIALRGWDLEGVHGAVLAGIQAGLDGWLDRPGELPQRFAAVDALARTEVRLAVGDGEVRGRAAGIDADGALRVETAEGPVLVRTGTVLGYGDGSAG